MIELLLMGILFSTPLCCRDDDDDDSEEKQDESAENSYPVFPFKFPSQKYNRYNTFISTGYDPIKEVWWKREDKWDIYK